MKSAIPQSLTSLSRDQLIHIVRAHEQQQAHVVKKAKYNEKDDDDDDDDDLEGCIAKAKDEFGVSSALRVDDITWSKQRRSVRSFASSSTAAELECLASDATPPGLLRNTNGMQQRPGNPQLAMMEEEDDDDELITDYDPVTKQFSC